MALKLKPTNQPTLKNKKIKLFITNRRVPRPLGITYMTKRYNEENNLKLKHKILYQIKYTLINHYLNKGLKFHSYNLNINEYLTIYNITKEEYNKILSDIAMKSHGITNLDDPQEITNKLRVELLHALNWALGDKHLIMSQLGTLQALQGDRYVPYLTGEVNRLLKTNIDATRGFTELIKMVLPQAGVTINNNLSQNNENSLTVVRAIELLKDEPTMYTLSEHGDLPQELLSEAELKALPDISAITQTGELATQVTLDRKTLKKVSHENRREALNDYEDVEEDDE